MTPGADRDACCPESPGTRCSSSPATTATRSEEGKISVREWREGCASGELTEVFACGTAAVITPVGAVKSAGGDWVIGDGKPGPVTLKLRDELIGIQYGQRADPYGWIAQDRLRGHLAARGRGRHRGPAGWQSTVGTPRRSARGALVSG